MDWVIWHSHIIFTSSTQDTNSIIVFGLAIFKVRVTFLRFIAPVSWWLYIARRICLCICCFASTFAANIKYLCLLFQPPKSNFIWEFMFIYIVLLLISPQVWITYVSVLQLIRLWRSTLTHWGRVTHICFSKLTTIGPDNGLAPGRRQAIIWTNAGILLIGNLRTNLSKIVIEIHIFSLKKMHLKVSSSKLGNFTSTSMR